MNYQKLTQAQSDAITADNRAMLQLSRARHAEHLAQQVADRENTKRPAWVDLDAAKNLLARRYAAQSGRRFTGEPPTGFGSLS